MSLPDNVENYLKDVMAIPSHAQHTELRKATDTNRLLVATLNVIRLELLDKEPEFADLIERAFLLCGINVED